MTLAILTPEQIGVSLLGGAILCGLWFAAEAWERRQNKRWRIEDRDGYDVTSRWREKR